MSLRVAGMVVLLIAVTVVDGPSPALAQKPDAREVKARELFAVGKYAEALDIYGKLYAETTHPTYLRNVGRCYQNMGEPTKAISSFREYLRQAKDLAPDQRAQVDGYIREMEDLKRRRETPAASSAAAAPATPRPTAPVAPPVSPPGLKPPPASTQAVPPPPPPQASPAPPAPLGIAAPAPPAGTTSDGDARRSRKLKAYVIGGIGIGALAAGAVFGIRAIQKRHSSDAECPMERCSKEGVALNEEAKTAARISDFTVGAGIVGIAVATYLLLSAPGGDSPARGTLAGAGGLTLSPALGLDEAGLSLGGSW